MEKIGHREISDSEINKIIDEYKFDWKRSLKIVKSFSNMMQEILEGETGSKFADKTGLNTNMLSKFRYSYTPQNPPRMYTFISVCIGYQISYTLAQQLLQSICLPFNPLNKQHAAYIALLTHCRGCNIAQCNEILQRMGVDEKFFLGSPERKH